MKNPLFLAIVLGIILGMQGCSGIVENVEQVDPQIAAEAIYLDIVAVPAGPGLWYVLAERMQKVLNDSVKETYPPFRAGKVLPGGGMANIILVHNGEAAFGITQGASVLTALSGIEPFDAVYDNYGMVLNLFPAVYQAIVLEDANINSMHDIKGKAINVMAVGTGSDLANRIVFEAYEITYGELKRAERLWFDSAYDLMRDGRLHGSFTVAPLPHPYTVDLAMARNIRVLSLEEDKLEIIHEINPALTPYIIPAGTYRGMDTEVITVQNPTILIANLDVSKEIVYMVTKLFVESWCEEIASLHQLLELSPVELAKPASFPFHPGAEKYFREQGLLD